MICFTTLLTLAALKIERLPKPTSPIKKSRERSFSSQLTTNIDRKPRAFKLTVSFTPKHQIVISLRQSNRLTANVSENQIKIRFNVVLRKVV